jgi:hypothetical protein
MFLNDIGDSNIKLTNSFSQFDRSILKIVAEEKEKDLDFERQKEISNNEYFKLNEYNNQVFPTKNKLSKFDILNSTTDKKNKSKSKSIEKENL